MANHVFGTLCRAARRTGCIAVAAFGALIQPAHAQVARPDISANPAQCAPLRDVKLQGRVTVVEYREAVRSTCRRRRVHGREQAGPAGFCRVAATLTPSADSEIKMELWLPANWNGKLLMVGNGAWSGAISYWAMAEPLRRGYAVASTDTGHEGNRGTFAFGHPEKLVDFAWRAVHETAVASKMLTTAYFGMKPRLSYWDGCSSGGKQGPQGDPEISRGFRRRRRRCAGQQLGAPSCPVDDRGAGQHRAGRQADPGTGAIRCPPSGSYRCLRLARRPQGRRDQRSARLPVLCEAGDLQARTGRQDLPDAGDG